MDSTVEILLSTFNGAKYLREQLDSIIQQDYQYWKLIVRDDGSTDSTLEILNEYIKKYPDKISLIKDIEGNLGHSNSFSKLLSSSTADFVMYCDQDDLWYPSKVSTMLSKMLAEGKHNPSLPLVVFSDIHVADSELNIISDSFLDKVHYRNDRGQQVFFLRNYVPGCNIMFNRSLIKQALKTNNIVKQHDHWLLMVCSIAGKIVCINTPLMKYRIHDNNTIGYFQPSYSFADDLILFFKTIFKYGFRNKKYRESLHINNIQQVENICARISSSKSKEAEYLLNIYESNFFSRKARNITKPYILETSSLRQLTYIICF